MNQHEELKALLNEHLETFEALLNATTIRMGDNVGTCSQINIMNNIYDAHKLINKIEESEVHKQMTQDDIHALRMMLEDFKSGVCRIIS